MRNSLSDEIRQKLLEEFVQTGRIELVKWIHQYPKARAELIDYRIRLGLVRGDDREEESSQPWEDRDVLRYLIRQHCQTLALGEAWAEQEVADASGSRRHWLAARLQEVRSTPCRKSPRIHFERVCILAWCVAELRRYRGEASRLGVNKITYLLERSLRLGIFDHQQMPFGPYDQKIRYSAEPAAGRKQYIVVHQGRYDTFEPGKKIAEALTYAPRYLRQEDLARALVEHFTRVTQDDFELETWATVQWVAQDLTSKGEGATPDTVQEALRGNAAWAKKLIRPNFARAVVERALTDLGGLGLISDQGAD